MSSPELKEYRMAGTAPMQVHRLAPIPLREAPERAAAPQSPGPDETLRTEVRAAVKRRMDEIIRNVLAETTEEREVRDELAKAGNVALNARAAACFRRLTRNGMDSIKAEQVVLRAVQEASR